VRLPVDTENELASNARATEKEKNKNNHTIISWAKAQWNSPFLKALAPGSSVLFT
jgi:hypothetical protein